MRLIPSLLNASTSDVAAFRARMRERYRVPAGTPAEEADLALEEIADKIIAYLSSPVPRTSDTRHRVWLRLIAARPGFGWWWTKLVLRTLDRSQQHGGVLLRQPGP
jgi:hypothetical protein